MLRLFFKGKNNKVSALSLVEVMLASAVLSTVFMGTFRFFSAQNTNLKKAKLKSAMRKIALQVEQHMKNPQTIEWSQLLKSENKVLHSCISSQNENICKNTGKSLGSSEDKPKIPFRLISFSKTSKGVKRTYFSNKSTGKKVFYDGKGHLCNPDGVPLKRSMRSLCFFEVRTYFHPIWRKCGPDFSFSGACTPGTYKLYMKYEVIPSASKNPYNLPTIKSPVFVMQTKSLSSFNKDRMQCNDGASLVGFDVTGRPRCSCFFPYVKDLDKSANNKGVQCLFDDTLVNQVCGEGTVFRGITDEGGFICLEAVQGGAFECSWRQGQECSIGEYVNGIKSFCTFKCYIPHHTNMKKDPVNEKVAYKQCGCLDFDDPKCGKHNYGQVMAGEDVIQDSRSNMFEKMTKYSGGKPSKSPLTACLDRAKKDSLLEVNYPSTVPTFLVYQSSADVSALDKHCYDKFFKNTDYATKPTRPISDSKPCSITGDPDKVKVLLEKFAKAENDPNVDIDLEINSMCSKDFVIPIEYKDGQGKTVKRALKDVKSEIIKNKIKDHRCRFYPKEVRGWHYHYGKCFQKPELVQNITEGLTCESEIRCCKQKLDY
jgi:hypothetical protein